MFITQLPHDALNGHVSNDSPRYEMQNGWRLPTQAVIKILPLGAKLTGRDEMDFENKTMERCNLSWH